MTSTGAVGERLDTLDRQTTPTRRGPRTGRLLGIYLNDHLAGATSGVRLAQRVAAVHRDLPTGAALRSLSDEIDSDRSSLISMMRRLGVPRRRYKVLAGWIAELAGRAKANGRVLPRSPLSTVEELEVLRLGVEGKRVGWSTLRTIAAADQDLDLDPTELDDLIEGATSQIERLDDLHRQAVREVLG